MSRAILAIDHGSKYLGLALAEETIRIAHPFGMIENRGEDYVLSEIDKIVQQKNIKKIIIGRPISLEGKITEQTAITDKFIIWLKNNLRISIETYDERLTTTMAAKINQGFKNNSQGHDVAATIFLQDYLDQNKKG